MFTERQNFSFLLLSIFASSGKSRGDREPWNYAMCQKEVVDKTTFFSYWEISQAGLYLLGAWRRMIQKVSHENHSGSGNPRDTGLPGGGSSHWVPSRLSSFYNCPSLSLHLVIQGLSCHGDSGRLYMFLLSAKASHVPN